MIKRISSIIALSACGLAFFMPSMADAASLFMSPSASSVSVGNIVSVKVLVATDGKAINNADAVLQFPSDGLEVISVNKGSSIFTLWVEDPKFSNAEGKITFNGGVPNPGFTGQNGEIISVTFRAKKQGAASLVFSDSAVRQNDGLGTNILTSKVPLVLQVGSAVVQPELPVVPVTLAGLPGYPSVTSSTHPQQDAWYSGTTATLSWNVASDITSVQTLLNKIPSSMPTVAYDASVSQRTLNSLSDGVWYFHIRSMNGAGWGPVTHYKLQIDATAPEKFTPAVSVENSRNIVALNARDTGSGIDSYLIQIDSAEPMRLSSASLGDSDNYTLPVQKGGEHTLTITAYDRAQNSTRSSVSFVSPALIAPEISMPAEAIQRGEPASVRGTSAYPGAQAEVYIQAGNDETKTYLTRTANDGSFMVESEDFQKSSSVSAWAVISFGNGVETPRSDALTFQVKDTLLVKTSKSVLYTFSFLIPATIVVLGLLFMIYLGWHRFFGLKRKLRKEVQGTISDIHKVFGSYKDELEAQLVKLESLKKDRDLNAKETKIFKGLQANIDAIDDFIEKRLKKLK